MTREEALEVMWKNLPSDKSLPVYEALQTLIPELAESEDERMCTRCIDLLRKVSAYSGEEYLGVEIADCIIWLQALIKKLKESLHITEICKEDADSFTDEDERIRKKLIEIIGYFRSRGIDHQLCEEFLSYLERQKEQKPEERFKEAREKYQVEWSEEDERMLKSTIWHISNSLTNGKNTDCKCDLTEWLKEKLKSLRPSWKPSEEQMDALSYALQVMNTDLSPIAAKTYQGLQEIQQNLRKLM